MRPMLDISLEVEESPIYFLSDAHLGAPAGPVEREDWLLQFIKEAQRDARALFVMGDLFDFWFEYRHAVPKVTFRIARALADCVDAGVRVVYFGGNHDFWAGSWLSEELGVTSFDDPIRARLQGRLVYLAHGDGLGPGDGGYKVLKKILRHPWAIAGYRALHPDFGFPFATWASHASRSSHDPPAEEIVPKVVRDIARPILAEEDVSALVMGHIHHPTHFSEDGKDFVLLGDWIREYTHLRMIDGRMQMFRRQADGRQEPIAARPFPPDPPRSK